MPDSQAWCRSTCLVVIQIFVAPSPKDSQLPRPVLFSSATPKPEQNGDGSVYCQSDAADAQVASSIINPAARFVAALFEMEKDHCKSHMSFLQLSCMSMIEHSDVGATLSRSGPSINLCFSYVLLNFAMSCLL